MAIQLEPFTKADFSTLIAWAHSEELLVQFAGPFFSFPLTASQLELYIADKNRFPYKVVLSHSTIGHAEIYLPDEKLAVLCRILIGDPSQRGQGFGQQIVRELLNISFNGLAVEKAELNVFDWNTSAIRCYEKAGFVINAGKTRKRAINGETWTALNMVIDKITWKDNL